MNPPRVPVWLIPSILLTAILSLWSISFRYRAEERNRAVTIAVEYETVEAYAAGQGKTVDAALFDLKQQGLGGVVLSEEYVADMLNARTAELSGNGVTAWPGTSGERLSRAISIRFPASAPLTGSLGRGSDMPSPTYLGGGISPTTLRATAVGINPAQAAAVKAAGLSIVARMANPPGVSGDYVRKTLDWSHELGANIYLPVGDQVLGRREALGDLTDELRKLGMSYASPEFAKLGGDDNVLRLAPDLVVRLHAAQAAELDKLPLADAVDRYSRAARERGMRVLLVRPISFASQTPLGSLADFVRRIDRECEAQGLMMGVAHPFADPGVPTWLFLLIGLSIAPTAFFVGSTFVRSLPWRMAGFALVTVLGTACISHQARPYAALLAALVFPVAAFLVLDARKRPNPWIDYFLVSGISLVGGLSIAGLLNRLPYFIRAEQFEGVKLAVFLPIFVVLIHFLMRGTNLKAAMRSSLTWSSLLLGLLIIGALLFMNSRTGNDNPAGVSDTELKLRFLLDRILLVRPRTKEFLVGHPLLFLGIGLLAAHRRRPNPRLAIWAALALAGGAIGQTDIVNTMCHIHTPVALSLARIGVGLVAGCIMGLAVWVIARRWLPAGEP